MFLLSVFFKKKILSQKNLHKFKFNIIIFKTYINYEKNIGPYGGYTIGE